MNASGAVVREAKAMAIAAGQNEYRTRLRVEHLEKVVEELIKRIEALEQK